MDLSIVRDIQRRVLDGKYILSPLILEIRPGTHSRMEGFNALGIPELTQESWAVRPERNENLVLIALAARCSFCFVFRKTILLPHSQRFLYSIG